jgi:hypothetical protein
MGQIRNAYKTVHGKLEGKRARGRTRCRWQIILKWTLKEMGWEDMN